MSAVAQSSKRAPPNGLAKSGDPSMNAVAAEADWFSAICRGIPDADQIVYLVSKEGKRFPVHEEVLKSSSDYFTAALENGMRESGKFQLILAKDDGIVLLCTT